MVWFDKEEKKNEQCIYNGSAWNRNVTYKYLGYDNFYYYDKDYDINEEEWIGLGLSDKSFFKQEVTKIKGMNDFSDISFEIKDNMIPVMKSLRKVVDEAEVVVGAQYWPYPTYADMLFYI